MGYLLLRGTTPISFVPVDGTSYNEGPLGDYLIVYKGNQLSYSDASVSNGTKYYYTIYSYDASDNYSNSVTGNVTANPRETYPFYHFVVDSVVGDGSANHTACLLESLELEIDGEWASSYNLSSETGTIDGNSVTVSESSRNGGDAGWKAFCAGRWQSAGGGTPTSPETPSLPMAPMLNSTSVPIRWE